MRLRLIPLLALAVLTGCSKIHEQRSFTVAVGGNNSLRVSAPLSEQKVQVVLTADNPVNVWILLETQIPAGNWEEFDPDAFKVNGLASEKNTQDATLTATIPAKEKYMVFVTNRGSKPASVTVKVDSQ